VASLWWSYCDRGDRRAADKLVAAEPEQRSRMGLLGYWYAHLALISGIVLIAAGIRQLLEAIPDGLLAGGMALFMLGDVFFRWVMACGHRRALLALFWPWRSFRRDALGSASRARCDRGARDRRHRDRAAAGTRRFELRHPR